MSHTLTHTRSGLTPRRWRLWLVCLTLILSACGGSDVGGDAEASGDSATLDAKADQVVDDGATASGDGSVAPDTAAAGVDSGPGGAPDTSVDTGPGEGCPGGAGCSCAGNDDCDAALCFETIDGKRCAAPCTEACPQGFACKLTGVGADVITVCLPKWGMFCRPCNGDNTCQSPGFKDAACVRHGAEGGFCGTACASDDDCPAEAGCAEVERVEGGTVKQCVQGGAKSAPSCACGATAKAQGWSTDCTQELPGAGGATASVCAGSRACGPTGLSACEKKSGTQCVDVQCLVDNKVDGAPVKAGTVCSDGVACTVGDVCDDQGVCQPGVDTCPCKTAADCTDDQDLCNGQPFCDLSADLPVCKTNPATVVTCPTGKDTPCVKNSCQPATGKCEPTTLPDKTPCDDGDSCTSGEACTQGACKGTETCLCQQQADCAKYEDGDACNGTLYCDLKSGSCELNPATTVQCPTVGDTACQKSTCAPKTGLCAMQPVASGPCDDNNPCTTGDQCKGGACVSGANACSCLVDADCKSKEDGNPCNGTLFCDKNLGTCAVDPSTIKVCPSNEDKPCLQNLCDPKDGACKKTEVAEGKACDDGDACTEGEQCKAGVCAAKTNSCTCKVNADCLAYEDGDYCNGSLFCDQTAGLCKVNPASVVSCPAKGETACTVNACKHEFGADGKATGAVCKLVPRPNGLQCTDDNPCTDGDVCIDGGCTAGKKVCECVTDAMCVPPGGAGKCAGKHVCKAGVCKQEGGKVCPTDNDTLCLSNQCQPVDGACALTPTNNDKPCDDGDACSTSSVCAGGKCAATQTLDCDDGNSCTADACAPKSGCTNTHADGSCDDGSPCTVQDTCVKSACKGTPAKEVCDGGKVDEDCDGQTDEEGAEGCAQWYLDEDGDQAPVKASKCLCGASGKFAVKLSQPPSAAQVDCDDNDKTRFPGAKETCDAKDLNCDGHPYLASQKEWSEGLPGSATYYLDNDGDKVPQSANKKLCAPAGKYTVKSKPSKFDCDDNNSKRYPGATETCSTSYDDDCDGTANEEGAQGSTTYYLDADGDNYHAAGKTKQLCSSGQVKGYTLTAKSSKGQDCHDGNGKYHTLTVYVIDQDYDSYAWALHTSKGWQVIETKPICVPVGNFNRPKSDVKTFGAWDCCDKDKASHSAATGWKGKKNACGSFDWNCDNKVELQYPVKANCPGKGSTAACQSKMVKGFKDGPPACGGLGQLLTQCQNKPGIKSTCVSKSWVTWFQGCR